MINQLGGAASPVQHLDKGNRAQASSRTIFLLSCLLILAVFAVYHQAASHPYFNIDDRVYVVDNVHVSAGLRWSTVKWSFISLEAFNWHPLTWLSHALAFACLGLHPLRSQSARTTHDECHFACPQCIIALSDFEACDRISLEKLHGGG